jgi:hypothetical protein
MAIVQTFETAEGRSVSGAARESFQYTRSFAIKVDDPATPMDDIAAAPGVLLGDPHPDDPSVFATSFDCSVSDDLLLYTLNVTYQAPPLIDASSDGPGSGGGGGGGGGPGGGYDLAVVPADTWSGSASVAAVPCTRDADIGGGGVNPLPITNTAGVGIPGLQKEQAFAQLQLVKNYGTLATLVSDMSSYTNKINSADWINAGDKWCWKCQGCNWQKITQSTGGVSLTYFQATWVFAFDDRQWKLEPLNVGYMDRSGGAGLDVFLKPIVNEDGDPVTEPVPLDENGLADLSGTPAPVSGRVLGAGWYVYDQTDFSYFGTPS